MGSKVIANISIIEIEKQRWCDKPKADIKHRIRFMFVKKGADRFIFDEMPFLPPERRDLDPDWIRFLELRPSVQDWSFDGMRGGNYRAVCICS